MLRCQHGQPRPIAGRDTHIGSFVMSEDNALVLVAGYQDLDSARHDFQTLVDAAKDKSIPLQG
ncbi:hypothetical protein EUB06_20715, partial [Mycobacterium tuberculosis]